jgi:uncharacterized membrane protein YbhN (UPF0104 family)
VTGPEDRDGWKFGTAGGWTSWVIRLGLTAMICWMTFRKVPLAGIWGAVHKVRPGMAALSVLLFVAGMVAVEAVRFLLAARLLEERQPSLRDWAWLYVESRPFFYLLPASVGTEGMVWRGIRAFRWRHASCGFVVLSTRVWGMGLWALGAALALALAGSRGLMPPQVPAALRHPLPWALLGAVVVAGCAAAPGWLGRRGHLPVRRTRWRATVAIALATAASVAMSSLTADLAAASAGTPLGLIHALGLLAIFNFVMILPVSLGGFGIQEALILQLGLTLGYSAPALLVFSFVIHGQRLVLSALGLALFLRGRVRA